MKKALFKGYSNLSYTMYSEADPDKFEIPISFIVKKGSTKVLIITVYFKGANNTHTINNLGDNYKIREALLELYKSNNKKGEN